MARRILNRKEMRADFDAAERRKDEDEEEGDEEEEQEDEDEEEEGESEGEEEEGAEDEEPGEDEEEADEERPKKKKKAAPKVAKPKAKPRSRAAKVVRMRVVWGVFNNSHQMVASYDYPKKADAEAHAAKLMADKRQTHFVQPVKEPMAEEKKEK